MEGKGGLAAQPNILVLVKCMSCEKKRCRLMSGFPNEYNVHFGSTSNMFQKLDQRENA